MFLDYPYLFSLDIVCSRYCSDRQTTTGGFRQGTSTTIHQYRAILSRLPRILSDSPMIFNQTPHQYYYIYYSTPTSADDDDDIIQFSDVRMIFLQQKSQYYLVGRSPQSLPQLPPPTSYYYYSYRLSVLFSRLSNEVPVGRSLTHSSLLLPPTIPQASHSLGTHTTTHNRRNFLVLFSRPKSTTPTTTRQLQLLQPTTPPTTRYPPLPQQNLVSKEKKQNKSFIII